MLTRLLANAVPNYPLRSSQLAFQRPSQTLQRQDLAALADAAKQSLKLDQSIALGLFQDPP